jgi:hypothetical protein
MKKRRLAGGGARAAAAEAVAAAEVEARSIPVGIPRIYCDVLEELLFANVSAVLLSDVLVEGSAL